MSGKAPVPPLMRRATLTEHVSPKPGIAKTAGLTIWRNADQTTAKRRETKSTKQHLKGFPTNLHGSLLAHIWSLPESTYALSRL